MTRQNLGRLERVELRDIWTTEATDFTPWLARTENLAVSFYTFAYRSEEAADKYFAESLRTLIAIRRVVKTGALSVRPADERLADRNPRSRLAGLAGTVRRDLPPRVEPVLMRELDS